MFTSRTLEILLTKLPKAAQEAYCAPGIINNLLSVSVLCDSGCDVWFYEKYCEFGFNGETIIRGWRDRESNMLRVSLQDVGGSNIQPAANCSTINEAITFPKFCANIIYECENTTQLIKFYHATLEYQTMSTLCNVITAGYFKAWPGLTTKRIRRYINVSDETKMGHMDQQQQRKVNKYHQSRTRLQWFTS